MDPAQDDQVAEATGALDFLLATRVQYELHQRRGRPAPQPLAAIGVGLEADHDPVDPDRDLRAAEFLLATRALRETNERAVQQGEAPDGPSR